MTLSFLEHAPIYSSMTDRTPVVHGTARFRAESAVEIRVAVITTGFRVIRVAVVKRIFSL
jgi:hypothetical protein